LSEDLVREFYEAARSAYEAGWVRAAALLACAGLEAVGGDENFVKVKDAVLAGLTPSAEDVESLLKELAGRIGGGEVVLEVDFSRVVAVGLSVVLISMAFLAVFPPWADAVLIPSAFASFLYALLRG